RREPRVADVTRVGRNGNHRRQIDAMKHDAGVGRRGTEHEIDARAGMKADTGRLDGRLESALLEHGNQPDQIACRVKGLAMILTWIRALGHAVAGAAAPPRSLRISPPACAETPGFPPHRRPAP